MSNDITSSHGGNVQVTVTCIIIQSGFAIGMI